MLSPLRRPLWCGSSSTTGALRTSKTKMKMHSSRNSQRHVRKECLKVSRCVIAPPSHTRALGHGLGRIQYVTHRSHSLLGMSHSALTATLQAARGGEGGSGPSGMGGGSTRVPAIVIRNCTRSQLRYTFTSVPRSRRRRCHSFQLPAKARPAAVCFQNSFSWWRLRRVPAAVVGRDAPRGALFASEVRLSSYHRQCAKRAGLVSLTGS